MTISRTFSIRMNEDLRSKLEQIAEDEGRTLGNLICKICSDYVKSVEEKTENDD